MITSENYVENVLRTDCEYTVELYERLLASARLLHAAMGLATEAGEFLDMLKKHIYYGKPLDKVNAKEECGDASWYIGLAIDELATTMHDVLTMNIAKLKLRYPANFTEECAIGRDVVAERCLLEGDFSKAKKEFENASIEELSNKAKKFLEAAKCDVRVAVERDLLEHGFEPPYAEPTPFYHESMFPKCSQRGQDWFNFSNEVFTHIENYTVPQYGDAPDDQVENWTIEHCLEEAKKYINRYGKVSDERQLRDFLKMGHYVQLAYLKHNNLLANREPEEINSPFE